MSTVSSVNSIVERLQAGQRAAAGCEIARSPKSGATPGNLVRLCRARGYEKVMRMVGTCACVEATRFMDVP